MHSPRWATAPTSGAGATHGGRANRSDVQALYLALEAETAVREYQDLATRSAEMRPHWRRPRCSDHRRAPPGLRPFKRHLVNIVASEKSLDLATLYPVR